MTYYTLLFILIIIHLYHASLAQKTLNKSLLSSSRIIFHSLMIWIVPIVWSLIVKSVYKKPEIMTKKRRKKEKEYSGSNASGGYY